MKPDFSIVNHGSTVQFQPLTQSARDWVSENLPLESRQWLDSTFVIDHRFADPIICGIADNGFSIRSH